MFEEIYAIACQAESFDELKVGLRNRNIDARNNGFPHLSVAGQLASENKHVKVEWLQQLGSSVNVIAQGYAFAGNNGKACEYRLRGLLDSYLKQRRGDVLETGETKLYLHCCLFFMFQKSYTEKKEAVSALVSALNGENVDLASHLPTLTNGRLGQELRQFVNDGHGNHLIGKEVNTVRAFVNALQDNLRDVINIKKAR